MELLDVPLPTAIGALAVVLLTAIYYWIKNRHVLTGPTGLPYLGLWPYHLSDKNVHLELDAYKKKYGDVFSFTCTGRLFIHLGSVKAIRELHINKSDCFAGRFTSSNVLVEMLRNGVTFVNGEPWKVLRKFFIQKFRDYGLNTVRDNMALYDSLNAVLDDLKAAQGKPVNIIDLLGKRTTVIMRKMIFGEEGVKDEELDQMIAAYGGALEGNMGINLLLIGPVARLLFYLKPSLRKSLVCHRFLWNIILACSKRIEKSMNEEQPTCIIEDYYKERNERRRKNDPTWKYFSDEALVDSVLQFIGDGTLSVAAFIAGFLSSVVEHPDDQEKLYAELMEVVGPNRQPTAEDRSNLQYANAFMNETLRLSTILNIFASLECTKETVLRGYRIPKGSITVTNFYSAHHDPETFENPDKFDPSRYLPSSPEKSKEELPVTFGMGKRSCSGEAFVMMQTFLFLTTILKNFKVVSSNAQDQHSLDFLVSGQLELTFVPRAEN